VVGVLLRIHRPEKVLGPVRIERDGVVWRIAVSMGIGAALWLGIQAIYGAFKAIAFARTHPGQIFQIEMLDAGDYAFLATVPYVIGVLALWAGDIGLDRGGRTLLRAIGVGEFRAGAGIRQGAIAFLAIGGNYDNPENIFHNRETEALDYLRDALPRIREKAAKYGILLENRLPVPEGPAVPAKNEPVKTVHESCGEHHRAEHPCGEHPRAERRMICHLPWIQMYIDYDGSIRPDCVCRREVSLGNVAGTSLKDAWNNAAMQEYRRRVAAGEATAVCNADCTEHRVSERYLKFS
jgi:hypothetical protein